MKSGKQKIKREKQKIKRGELKDEFGRYIFLIAGSSLIAFNIASFVRPAGLFPGGFSGISLLVQEICQRYWGFTPPY